MKYVLVFLLLTACGGVRDTLGLGKNLPDEFAVRTHAPLSIPPEFALRPPQAGAIRPQEARAEDIAKQALVGSSLSDQLTTTDGQSALLQKAGAAGAAADIRTLVNAESGQAVKATTSKYALSGLGGDTVQVNTVDEMAERDRINKAIHNNQTVDGADVKAKKSEDAGFWDWLF